LVEEALARTGVSIATRVATTALVANNAVRKILRDTVEVNIDEE
jgi:hypothetical protein